MKNNIVVFWLGNITWEYIHAMFKDDLLKDVSSF